MEEMLYKTLPETIQDQTINRSHGLKDVLESTLSSTPIENKSMNLSGMQETKEGVNGHVDINLESSGDGESANKPPPAQQKISSPTLIESAFKVMKNLFSPEKAKSKSLSPAQKQQTSSGSPNSSICITSKPEFACLDTGIQNPISTLTEESAKNPMNMNQVGVLFSPLPVESHNNTDESFLTTVSIIDESFHSAITNLDENGETTKLETKVLENFLNNTQNSDFTDLYNDTLENTTLRNGSFNLDGTKLENLSVLSKDGSGECWSKAQANCCDGNSLGDCSKNTVVEIQSEAINEGLCNGMTERAENSANAELENSKRLKDDYTEDLRATVVQSGTLLERKMENLLSSRSCVPCGSDADFFIEPTAAGAVHESDSDAVNVERKTSEIDFLRQVERKESEFCFENANLDDAVSLADTISTTTVVLNTVDSVDLENILDSLKDGSEANTTSSRLSFLSGINTPTTSSENMLDCESFKDVDQLQPFEPFSENTSGSGRNSFPMQISPRNKSCVSEMCSSANAPNVNKFKLHKSDEVLNRRMSSDSLEGKRTAHRKESSFDLSLIKNTEASKNSNAGDYFSSEVPAEMNIHPKDSFQDQKKPTKGAAPEGSTRVSIISQQSYTILTVDDINLNRPVIEPVTADGDFPESKTFQTPELKKTCAEKTLAAEGKNYCKTPVGATDSETPSQQKHSTPLRKENAVLLPKENLQTVAKPISLDHSTPKESTCQDKSKPEHPLVSSKAEAFGSKTQKLNPNEYPAEFSPVNPVNENELIFSNSVESETEGNQFPSAPGLNSTRILTANDSTEPNRTSESKGLSKKSEEAATKTQSPAGATSNLNKTFDKKHRGSLKLNVSAKHVTGSEKLNATFDKSPSPTEKSNKTFTKEPERANQTFTVSGSPECNAVNKTFNKSSAVKGSEKKAASPGPKKGSGFEEKPRSPVPAGTDQTTNAKSSSPVGSTNKTNETFVKEKKWEGNQQKKVPEINKTFDVIVSKRAEEAQGIGEGRASGKQTKTVKCPNGGVPVEQSFDQQVSDNHDGCHRDMNGSFVSSRSSNTSLMGTELSTFFLNEGSLSRNESMEELAGKMGKLNLNESFEGIPIAPGAMLAPAEDQIAIPESVSLLDDKLKCDPYLVQLIQEQFSSNEIEKICSVVDDLSATNLTSQILKASEQFDKSFHENLSSTEPKPGQTEPPTGQQTERKVEKLANPLSPKSFDFLSSIQGKPTGRDWSRESLYVKFDPLVQPNPNSLIDFTKEAEALSADETSPVVAHDSSVCEQLLAISPQKKPDDIVPPLTPLSHRSKAEKSEDKMERIKELQNEIYFLKNLYSERERTNKAKMEDYESQVAKLTGESCFLEGRLKESSEREKALVKKMKEQAQGLSQLKLIMEEYVKVISKLTAELETLKTENQNQIEALSAEKDSYMTHLQNTEAAFTDVHSKYEKSKKTIVSLKSNEAMFKSTIAEQAQKMEDFKAKAKEAQEKAMREVQKIQEELSESKASHGQETARLRAQLRKTELKVEALQESLDQKIKENQQLTAICDELIEGKK